jgi:hypothetical protein
MIRNLVAIGDNQVAGNELVAESRSECDEQVTGIAQERRTLPQIRVDIGFEILEYLLGKAPMVGKAHPQIPIFVEIAVFVEQIGLEHKTQRPVDGNRVEEHPERIGTHLKTVRVEIVSHIVGETGSDQHHSIVFLDMERVLRGGYDCSELHILLFGYQ